LTFISPNSKGDATLTKINAVGLRSFFADPSRVIDLL
jgi:hypothetical protein